MPPVQANVFIFVELVAVVITLSRRATRASVPPQCRGCSQITTPNPYTYSPPVFCIITVERTKPTRPVFFSPPALRLLNARVKKLAGPCTSLRRGRKERGREPFLSSADVKIAFKSFEDALVSFYLADKSRSLDVQLVTEEGKKKPEGWKKGEASVPQEIQTVLPAVSVEASTVKTP